MKGLQVAPAELEALLLENPNLADAAVVGVTMSVPSLSHGSFMQTNGNRNGEENPRAYVVKSAVAGRDATPEAVAKWVEARVSRHKRLTGGVKFIDAVLKNPVGFSFWMNYQTVLTWFQSGKILRRFYRDIAKEEVGDSEGKASRL